MATKNVELATKSKKFVMAIAIYLNCHQLIYIHIATLSGVSVDNYASLSKEYFISYFI